MRLRGPENCGGFTFDGRSFAVDGDGCIVIDDDSVEAISAAISHGYTQAAEKPKRGRPRKSDDDGAE